MSDTIHVEAELARYFRGELTGEPRAQLFAHLGGCAECRARFDAESEAHRLLSGQAFGRVELSAMLPELLDGASPPPATLGARLAAWLRGPRVVGLGLAAAAALGLVVALRGPVEPSDPYTPKGGPSPEGPLVEVLCFDAKLEVTTRTSTGGACRAPGYVKVVYRRPTTVPVLTVLVLGDDGVRLRATVAEPKPLAVVPDHARLGVGEVLRVIAVAGPAAVPEDIAKAAVPVLTVRGTP